MICRKCKKEIPGDSAFCNLCGAKQELPARAPKNRGNGQGSVYKRNNKWAASITKYRRGQRITKSKSGFAKKSEALDWIAEVKQSRARVETTLDSLYQVWLSAAAPKLSKSKQTAYKIAWKRLDSIAYDNIVEITIGDLQKIVGGLTYDPAKDIKVLLSHLYKRACAQGDVGANLAQFIELPTLDSKEADNYTQDELIKMWTEYLNGEMFVGYMLLMIYSGMMPGELQKCEKTMINLEEHTIIGCGIKTKERRTRPIVFPAFMVTVLEQLIRHSASSKYLLAMNHDKFYESYHTVQKKIGIRDLAPYSCRHTTATALALGDAAAPSIIARVMRQTRPITTQRYTHADVQTVRDVVDNMLDNPLIAPPTVKN